MADRNCPKPRSIRHSVIAVLWRRAHIRNRRQQSRTPPWSLSVNSRRGQSTSRAQHRIRSCDGVAICQRIIQRLFNPLTNQARTHCRARAVEYPQQRALLLLGAHGLGKARDCGVRSGQARIYWLLMVHLQLIQTGKRWPSASALGNPADAPSALHSARTGQSRPRSVKVGLHLEVLLNAFRTALCLKATPPASAHAAPPDVPCRKSTEGRLPKWLRRRPAPHAAQSVRTRRSGVHSSYPSRSRTPNLPVEHQQSIAPTVPPAASDTAAEISCSGFHPAWRLPSTVPGVTRRMISRVDQTFCLFGIFICSQIATL